MGQSLSVIQPKRVANRDCKSQQESDNLECSHRRREVLSLKGHEEPVASVSFSPDGTRIVTASWDKTAKVWDATTGAMILTLQGHNSRVNSASFSPDGLRIITASDD